MYSQYVLVCNYMLFSWTKSDARGKSLCSGTGYLESITLNITNTTKSMTCNTKKVMNITSGLILNPQSTGLDNDWRLLGIFIFWNIISKTNWKLFDLRCCRLRFLLGRGISSDWMKSILQNKKRATLFHLHSNQNSTLPGTTIMVLFIWLAIAQTAIYYLNVFVYIFEAVST